MSSLAHAERPDGGSKMLLRGGKSRPERLPGYFTSWRSAAASLIILAVVVTLLVVDLVVPLLG